MVGTGVVVWVGWGRVGVESVEVGRGEMEM